MKQQSAQYLVKELAQAYEVSSSGYYQWQYREEHPSPRQQENEQLVEQIKQVHTKKYQRYGSPKMTKLLQQQGYRVNHKRIARLMRENGLRTPKRKPFRPQTTQSDPTNAVAPNRLAQIRELTGINQVWVSDITYIATREGWLFLAAVMDLRSRRILGWVLRETLHSEGVIQAHQQAFTKRRPAAGLICHSDRGVQYTSQAHRNLLEHYGCLISMSRKANCYDNAAMESFWSLLKSELLPENGVFETKAQAKREIFEYIEVYYNRQRLHSALGYKSPVDFEVQNN